jgi:methyl-accepting chemotaxis protein
VFPILQWFLDQLLSRWITVLVFFLPVAVYFYFSLRRIKKETEACLDWTREKKADLKTSALASNSAGKDATLQSIEKAENGDAPNTYITEQLGVFLEEAERWRVQGIAVPMTDYSDRIDSLIDGFVDRLHNAVNLFLVAGLAGTFFGMAEFARQTSALQQATDSRVVLEALRTALGHSFPIGFLGLALTIVFHPWASYRERKLREASTSAVNQALQSRTALLKQSTFEGLVTVMRELPQELAEALKPANEGLVTQLKPLLDLPNAIQKSNQELLDPLKELFTESRKEWKDTLGKLDRQSERVSSAIEKLEQPIHRLTGKIDDIGVLISSMASVTEKVLGDAQKITATTERLNASVAGTVNALDEAAAKLSTLPEKVQADMSNLHVVLRERIGSYYERVGRDYVDSMLQLAGSSVGNITDAATHAGEVMQKAAQSLQNMAESLKGDLESAIDQGAKRIQAYATEIEAALRQNFPQTVADMQTALNQASSQIESARAVLDGMTAAGTLTAEHAQHWSKVGTSLQELATALHDETDQLERSAKTIQESVVAQTKASLSLDRTVGALDRSVGTLEFALKGIKIPQPPISNPSLWERTQRLFKPRKGK